MFPIATSFLLAAVVCHQSHHQGYAMPADIKNTPLGQTANFTQHLKYLRKYQYLADSTDTGDSLLRIEDVAGAIRRLQDYGNIPVTGEFDPATIDLMQTPRCGVPDPVGVSEDGAALGGSLDKRYAHTGSKWQKNTLVYRILNTASSSGISNSQSLNAIRRAFKVWSDVTPLKFEERTKGYADTYLKFGTENHGDQYPFDGYGGTLAHAYPPMSGFGDLDGDVHFDDAEPFTDNTPDGTNLFQVATHEIGHALGLAHSNVAGSLMAPFYQGYDPQFRLPDDDRIGIQVLYGGPNPGPDPGPKPDPNPATSAPTLNPVGCNYLSFKAIGYIRSELFAFKGPRYWRIRTPKQLLTTLEGDETKYFWYELPSDIDGAYERYHDQRILFFKGDQYWEYDSLKPLNGFPKPISTLSRALPTNIDAVLTYNEYRKTYFFKGHQVWRFDEGTKTVDKGWPYTIDEIFHGVPSTLGAAFRYKDGIPFFVKGSQYYVYNETTRRVDPGYPKSFGADFLGCQPNQLQIQGKGGATSKTPTLWGIALGTLLMVLNQIV